MTIDILRAVLGWAALLNMGLLLFWFAMFMIGHDWVYRVHSNWFKMSVEEFDATHYKLMGFYELALQTKEGVRTYYGPERSRHEYKITSIALSAPDYSRLAQCMRRWSWRRW